MTLPPGPAWLFVPADRPDRYAKAVARADATVVDLVNAIAPPRKASAREAFRDGAADLPAGRALIRINPPGSPWYAEDVAAVRGSSLTTVILPGATTPDDVVKAAADLDGRDVVVLCDTAAGLRSVEALAEHSAGMFWGAEDLMAGLGGTTARGPDGAWLPFAEHARARVRFAAAAAGVPAIDCTTLFLPGVDHVTREAREAAAMGFAVKTCVHPDQVDAVRLGFRASPDEAARARTIVETADAGAAVFALDGRLVDAPLITAARNLLARNGS